MWACCLCYEWLSRNAWCRWYYWKRWHHSLRSLVYPNAEKVRFIFDHCDVGFFDSALILVFLNGNLVLCFFLAASKIRENQTIRSDGYSFALESLCFQFTRCSYSTFFSSFVRTKLTYCVSTVQTIACMRRETVFLQLAAEWENAGSKKNPEFGS